VRIFPIIPRFTASGLRRTKLRSIIFSPLY
jgi:hypothetical protein